MESIEYKNTEVSPILTHLEELRRRLILLGGAFIVFFALSFMFVGDVYSFLIRDLEDQLAILGPGDIVWVYMAFQLSLLSFQQSLLPHIKYGPLSLRD
nr:twin-arginine translocase subunit TatC [Thalassobacillus sp. C254]